MSKCQDNGHVDGRLSASGTSRHEAWASSPGRASSSPGPDPASSRAVLHSVTADSLEASSLSPSLCPPPLPHAVEGEAGPLDTWPGSLGPALLGRGGEGGLRLQKRDKSQLSWS